MHMVVCVVLCGEYTYMFVCYMYMVYGCVYLCISVCIHVCQCLQRTVDTNLQVYYQ